MPLLNLSRLLFLAALFLVLVPVLCGNPEEAPGDEGDPIYISVDSTVDIIVHLTLVAISWFFIGSCLSFVGVSVYRSVMEGKAK